MVSDPWMNPYQVLHAIGHRDTPNRPKQGESTEEDRRLLKALYGRVERGTFPAPSAHTPAAGEQRWRKSAIEAWMEACEAAPNRGRRSARPRKEARHG
jgi:hypothetical protein